MASSKKAGKAEIYRLRLTLLRKAMKSASIDTLLVSEMTNIGYLTGFTGSSAKVVVSTRGAWFFTDFRYTLQSAEEVCGFKVNITKKSFLLDLAALLKRTKSKELTFESSSITHDAYLTMRRALRGVSLKPAKGIVEAVRQIKDPSELKSVKKAVQIAGKGFREAERLLKRLDKGITEKDVSEAIFRVLKKNGALGPSFDIIVASGARSALPHGIATDKRIKKGEFVIVDMGATYNGYNSDATRTFITGVPTNKQAEIYRVVKEAHDLAIEMVKPGVRAMDIDRAAREHIARAGYAEFFGHGTGHGIGLNVHEGPNIGPASKDKIKEGMIFTVEPGIYLPGFGGVRIEDMVLVTKTGYVILTKSS